MTNFQKIEYFITKEGKVTERVIEGIGDSCTKLTQNIEKSIGQVNAQELLPEYYDCEEDLIDSNYQSLKEL